jgi:uncharacterized protein (TIGR04255 family)
MKGTTLEVKDTLPEFTDPPVVEVALSVQFEPLTWLLTHDLALYWSDVLGRTYTWKEAPVLPPAFELFGIDPPPTNVGVVFQLEAPPPHRALLFSADETDLVQVQRDRFVRNWRKATETPYPRYKQIRTSFRDQFEAFCSFVADRERGACVPNQCEVTYVNHIPWGRAGQPTEDLSEVLTAWTTRASDTFLGRPEQVEATAHYVMKTAGDRVGRLHVAAQTGRRPDDLQPLLALTLTARGRPASNRIDDIMSFLDLGHEHVVRGFASLTTPAMHQRWGRIA